MKVAIVDDHKMFRQGVESMLADHPKFSLAWGASNSEETLALIKKHIPDVILMDISLGEESGISLTGDILLQWPKMKIIGLSMHKEDNYIIKLLEAGAKGYLLKDAGSEEMIKAIEIVHSGETYFNAHVSNVLVRHLSQGSKPKRKGDLTILTKREKEILKLITEEFSNPEIAEKLFISIRTVDTHRRNLLDKLQVKNTAGLVKYAILNGLS